MYLDNSIVTFASFYQVRANDKIEKIRDNVTLEFMIYAFFCQQVFLIFISFVQTIT